MVSAASQSPVLPSITSSTRYAVLYVVEEAGLPYQTKERVPSDIKSSTKPLDRTMMAYVPILSCHVNGLGTATERSWSGLVLSARGNIAAALDAYPGCP